MLLCDLDFVSGIIVKDVKTGNDKDWGRHLVAARYSLEQSLDCLFDRTVRRDYFSWQGTRLTGGFDQTQLRLTTGLIDSSQDFKIYFPTSSTTPLVDPADGTEVDTEDYEINYDQGRVILYTQPPIANRAILVRYTHGFTVTVGGVDPPYDDVFNSVPYWLQAASAVHAGRSLNALTVHHNKDSTRYIPEEYAIIASKGINAMMRPRVGLRSPTISVAE